MLKPKIYFGHPVNVYDTKLESNLLKMIESYFPEYEIENPNQPHHAKGYQEWKEQTGKGMDYYFKKVLPSCIAGVFLPFRDGAWGIGVFGEAKFLADNRHRIWTINHRGIISLATLEKVQVLSIVETVARIRTSDGQSIPY